MKYLYRTKGVCSSAIELDIEDGRIVAVKFHGGCNGNASGISMLVKGENAEDVARKLKGITCGLRKTSCPDQLAVALEEHLESK